MKSSLPALLVRFGIGWPVFRHAVSEGPLWLGELTHATGFQVSRLDIASDHQDLAPHTCRFPGAERPPSVPDEFTVADMLRGDLAEARKQWLDEVKCDPDSRAKREESDFLTVSNHDGQKLDFHSLRFSCGGWLCLQGVPKGTHGLPRERWTKEQSYQAANDWLDIQLLGTKPIVERITEDAGGLETLAAKLVNGQASGELLAFIAKHGSQEPSAESAEIMQAMARAINPQVPHNATVSASIDAFLDTLRTKGMKAKTYKEIHITMDTLKEWWGQTPVAELDEKRVADAYKRIASMDVSQNTKHKRWGFFKRWAKYVWSMGVIEMPRNLESPLFRFKQQAKAIKTYPIEVVRQSLMAEEVISGT